ncbi:MAG: ABC transporter family substrate-binding protein [Tractidigestivibacter sp.]|jgi:peptide/nickel transport system substrate-binding protein|uniref:ABC transporter family substrate-binding protein n=1 Tax=Tractidigestivibacter sp. TaxID=2847320 RepID=UPI003D93F37C
MKSSNLSRRSFLGVSGAAATLMGLGLAGCGGSSDSSSSDSSTTTNDTSTTGTEPQEGSPATTALDQLPLPEAGKAYNNPQERDNVQDGGELVLPSGEIGPNWNMLSVEGNTVEMKTLWSYYMPVDIFISDETGSTWTPNPDFITNVDIQENGDSQTVTFDLNQDAKFNDGTPLDYRAYQAIWTVMNGSNTDYTPAATDGYDRITSVERGDNDFQVVITASSLVYPPEALFTQVIHPDAADPEVFNSGWNVEPHAEWGYGPYTIDSVSETEVVYVPNENWWGDAPKLDKITYKQMDSQALFNAFRNGEIDATGTAQSGSQEMLSNFSSMEDAYVRRANSISIACIEVNTTRDSLSDIAVRKAFMQCLDQATIRSVVFNGVNWDEDPCGSLMYPFWADGIEDNRPDDVKNIASADDGIAAAKQTLEDAGYTLNDDGYYEKDGQQVSFSFTTFGDSNMVKNRAAAVIQMAKSAGMLVEQDAKASSEFSETLSSGEWDTVLFGWSGTPTSFWNLPQIYGSDSSSNFTGWGSTELDEKLAEAITKSTHEEQMAAVNEAEKEALESYAFIPLYNGPDVVVTKKGLANYGPALYHTDYVRPEDIGWQKDE